ncbi:MAG: BlaI/MecI/CopY family transcriptional regulator [Candidatus Aminicenantes bacterium]|nr:MAG: BlaI/MecI/CopY family transcriptional regulator [Candidatus Aminicenantes bacterium]
MKKKTLTHMSRRERQIMDIIYQKGEANAAEVRELLPDPPTYSSVRALLRVLESNGFLKHREHGPRYIYSPTITLDKAKISALRHLMQTFFDDSAERVFAALLNVKGVKLTDEELKKISSLIEKAKKEGK